MNEKSIDKALEFLSYEDYDEVVAELNALESIEDKSQMLDHVLSDDVCPCEQFEYTFTVQDFLDTILVADPTEKFAIVRLEERNSNELYTHIQLARMSPEDNVKEEAERLLSEFFGDENPENDYYWDESYERTISMFSYKEITEEEFNVLKKFI